LGHYLRSKLLHPRLRAVIVVPKWRRTPWFRLMRHFRVVEELATTEHVFTCPTNNGIDNRVIFVLDACKNRLRAHSPEHPLTRAVSVLQHVILFFDIPRSSKVVCVLAGRIGIGNLIGQLHPMRSPLPSRPRPLVDRFLPTKAQGGCPSPSKNSPIT
jgi:hypothetical protein